MRSIIGFAVLVAAIGFSGCCGTGSGTARGLLAGGKIGQRVGQRADARAARGTIIEAGDCGCGGEAYSDPSTQYGDGGCGCGSDSVISTSAPYECGSGCMEGGAPVVSPMEFSAPAGECEACNAGASRAPRRVRGRLKEIGSAAGNGMGLSKNDRGLVCNDGSPNGSSGLAARRAARSLEPRKTRTSLKDKFGFARTEDTIVSNEEYDLVSDEYTGGCDECSSGIGRRRISHGVISDFREARRAHSGSAAGCGRGGCGHSGRLCGACSKIRSLAGLGSGSPYGGAIPHTAQAPGQSGMAPSYAYPYYTTRGPRDFLRDNPPSIGR